MSPSGGGEDLGPVRCSRQVAQSVQANHRQATVNDPHEQSGKHAGAGNLARKTGIVSCSKLTNIRCDHDAERKRGKQIHGLVPG